MSVVTYFINVQQCIKNLNTKQTLSLLNQNLNFNTFDIKPGHQCISCDYKLCEEGSKIFDNLKNFVPSFPDEIKMALIFIARYIIRNDNQMARLIKIHVIFIKF